jgi:preprotein translocase subunit SecD
MDTNKTAYWIALGVLALGLHSEYRHGNFLPLHRVADRAGAVMCRVSTQAERILAPAKGTSADPQREDDDLAVSDGVDSARTRVQSMRADARANAEAIRDQVRAQMAEIRAQREVRRAMIEQARSLSFRVVSDKNPKTAVFCPKTGMRVVVTRDSDFADASPEVEVDDSF